MLMPTTLSRILLHIVFSTKKRACMITTDVQPRLYAYIGGIVRDEKGTLLEIGGMPDHVHLLIRWRTDESVATLMQNVKGHSSRWVHQTFPTMRAFAWQEGYGVFSVSESRLESVCEYIRNQEQHHRGKTFEEEFVAFLNAHNIEYDDQYLWD